MVERVSLSIPHNDRSSHDSISPLNSISNTKAGSTISSADTHTQRERSCQEILKKIDVISIKRSSRRSSSKSKAKEIHDTNGYKSKITLKRQVIKEPHDHDVLCGRGGGINSHSGNKNFRNWVKEQKEIYNLASNKNEKAAISEKIVNRVKALDPSGRFLIKKKVGGTMSWVEIDLSKALAKTCQALREGAPSLRAQIRAKEKLNDGTTKSRSSKRNNGKCKQSKKGPMLSTNITTSECEELGVKKDTHHPIIRCMGGGLRGKVLIPCPSQGKTQIPMKKRSWDCNDINGSSRKRFRTIQRSPYHLEQQRVTPEIPEPSSEETTMEKIITPTLMQCQNSTPIAPIAKPLVHMTDLRSHSLAMSEMSDHNDMDEYESFQNPFEEEGNGTLFDESLANKNANPSAVDTQIAPDRTIATHTQSNGSIKPEYIFESSDNLLLENPNKVAEEHNLGDMNALKNIYSSF